MGISKDLTEEDVKFRYINEAITSKGWSKDSIFMAISCIERNLNLPTISRSARLLTMRLTRRWQRYSMSWGLR